MAKGKDKGKEKSKGKPKLTTKEKQEKKKAKKAGKQQTASLSQGEAAAWFPLGPLLALLTSTPTGEHFL